MKVLGITTEGDSGAALVEDGRILSAINEERLARLKLVVGFPRQSIQETLRVAGVKASELDYAMIAATQSHFVDELEPFNGWLQPRENGRASLARTLKRSAGSLARYGTKLPFMEAGYYALQFPAYWRRQHRIREILSTEFEIECPIYFVDHHFAHLTSAYFTSGFKDALVVSIDGGGDGRSSLVYAVRDGDFQPLHEVSAFNSLGNYYAYITHLCGYKAMKHEGKITGLAAHGEPKYLDLLQEFIVEEHGTFKNTGGVAFQAAIHAIESRLPREWQPEDLAASIQRHFEDLVTRYIQHWARESGLRDVALAGGVFANVRVNEEVLHLTEVDRVFIHPHMTDGGLSVGAALAAAVPGELGGRMMVERTKLEDVYFGPDLEIEAIRKALSDNDLQPEELKDSLEKGVARLLTEGYVVARANGRMEYGPRALGNRSILYHPTDRSVNDWLNENLNRTEFMPFAPSIRSEAMKMCFKDSEGGEHPAEFMTITFHCTDWMVENMPGVVHVDGTARPHVVRNDRNPGFYKIIEEFEALTGLPGLINTSFNMHEEPIVNDAEDCVRAFLAGNLDYLAIGPFLVKHPEGVNHPLTPVIPAKKERLQAEEV